MGWLMVIGLAAVTAGALWRWGGLPRASVEPLGAALLLGLAGYALQGSAAQPGNPVEARADVAEIDEEAILQRNRMGDRFGGAAGWLTAADGVMRAGMTRSGVTFIKSGLREHPDNPDLWVGLGNALVVHADGMVSPAAQYAFERAATLSPEHPGPPFFLGLALAQSGQVEPARELWLNLLARTPEDAPWRGDLEARLAEIGTTLPQN